GSVYAAGGFSFGTNSVVTTFQRYDPGANAWTPLAPLPTGTALSVLAFDPVGNRLFLFGGSDGTNALGIVQVYSIAGNSWSAGPALPDVRGFMMGGTIGNTIYLAGGYSTGQVTDSQSQTWAFDPAGGTYAVKTPMPAAFGGAGYAVVGGKLYVMGGRDGV